MTNQEENILENVEQIENQDPNISFENAALIIGVQILPQSESSLDRSVIISAGIKGEAPLLSSCTLLKGFRQLVHLNCRRLILKNTSFSPQGKSLIKEK